MYLRRQDSDLIIDLTNWRHEQMQIGVQNDTLQERKQMSK